MYTALRALFGLTLASLCLNNASAIPTDDPFADVVIAFDPGVGGSPGYDNPLSVLGSPERFTGEDIFPSVVSAFSSPYSLDEIVSLGAGGYITVQFNTPVVDDPNNLYGIDLLIFNNTSFIDVDWPNGIVGGYFGEDGGIIEVSDDGSHWRTVKAIAADGPFPTIGYVDSGPYDDFPGSVPTDFTRPVDPSLTLADFQGLTNAQIIQRYRGSGGGVGIDIGSVGLSQISFVRISNPPDARENIEIDAFADVSPRKPGDATLDGAVNVSDLLAVIGAWGATVPGGVPADFNNDAVVNVSDLLVVINHWGM